MLILFNKHSLTCEYISDRIWLELLFNELEGKNMMDAGKIAMEMYFDRSERYSAMMFQDAEQYHTRDEDDDGVPLDPKLKAIQDEKEDTGNVKNAAKDPKTEKTRKPGEKEGDAKNVINPQDVMERVTPEEKAEKQQKKNNEIVAQEIEKHGGIARISSNGVQIIGTEFSNEDNSLEGQNVEKLNQFANADLGFNKELVNIMNQLNSPKAIETMAARVQPAEQPKAA
jgi:hypothetical protein